MFQVPSTPDSQRVNRSDAPSTTPAGPPPTGYTDQSFTPAGPPPSSVFGSSYGPDDLAISKPAFGPSGHLNSPSIKGPLHTQPNLSKKGFAFPSSSPPRPYDDGDSFADGYSEDADGDDLGMDMSLSQPPKQRLGPRESIGGRSQRTDSPRGMKRSRNGDIMAGSLRSSRISRPRDQRNSPISGVAKSLAAGSKAPPLTEAMDDLILKSEAILSQLDNTLKTRTENEVEQATTKATSDLLADWNSHTSKESIPAAIGPTEKSPFTKANYLASLLFHIHHPLPAKHPSHPQASFAGRSSRFTSLVPASLQTHTPLPRSLLDWLNEYHNPYPEDLPEVLQCKSSPTAHERFWDTVFATMLRGNMTLAVQMLQGANFAHADTALEDGYDEPGYKGRQLNAVQYVVSGCVDLLKTCPAFRDGDWDIKNNEWALFRKRVRHALEDLEAYADEGNTDRDGGFDTANVFQSSRFGTSISQASRRAESKVPWTVFEQLKTIYGQLLGYREEILLSAQDWLEAVVYLTAWWDGEDDEMAVASLAASRRSLRQAQQTRQVDVSPVAAYKRRLLSAFADVTDEPEDAAMGVNTVDPVQVGLACICEDDIEGVVGLIRGWSVPVAVAVVDVASAGGWLPDSRPRSGGVMNGFDASDLMVLSHGQSKSSDGVSRDDILTLYADLLAQRKTIGKKDDRDASEGWELAVRALNRLDSADLAQRKIGELFDSMDFSSTEQVNQALEVCNALGLSAQVRGISERYANSLAETSQSYGDAIIYYARARSVQQLRSTLDLLISMSLVQSAAYPPPDALDEQLDALLNDQRNTLNHLARLDLEGAQLVATHLSGYATLRRFYELRDESDEDKSSKKSGLRPFSRKREAAKAILAVISSAADSIRGGLFDAETEAVVQVDALLALLGEALPLMDQPKPLLKQAQLMTLLRATEDLQTVTSRVYGQAEALFHAAMSDYNGSRVTSPQDLTKSLSKSVSNLSASGYGMVNSRGSVESEGGSSGDAQDIKRAWDWRKGIAVMAGKGAKGEDLLRVLRVQVAKEMASAWI